MTTAKTHPDMMTKSGVWVDYSDLAHLDVRLEDIRRATENICRYVGHLNWHLLWHLALCGKLAEHHLESGSILNPSTPAYMAIHDFHEIYVADIPAGLKKYVPDYCKIEDAAEARVHQVLGLPIAEKDAFEVKFIDLRALVCEMYLLDHPAKERCAAIYGGPPTGAEITIAVEVQAMSAIQAWGYIMFLLETQVQIREENYDRKMHGSEYGSLAFNESRLG